MAEAAPPRLDDEPPASQSETTSNELHGKIVGAESSDRRKFNKINILLIKPSLDMLRPSGPAPRWSKKAALVQEKSR